jgi:aspartyl-tRNA synthetase
MQIPSQRFRTHRVMDAITASPGQEIVLSGWVQRRRDLGSIVFVDLRDRSGIIQLVFDRSKGTPDDVMGQADQLRNEYVFTAFGTVVPRDPGSVNPKMAFGHVEVVVMGLEILNAAKNPPFYIQDGVDVDEAIRLRHRYLDLRRPEMQNILMLRHRVFREFRNFLDKHGFVEVETPILTKSTPEGARDYVVPSRLQAGEFYALPQSPQLFKQLLMVAGMERYYQIARCFRDEDLRADRQPEFTQLDIEMSFMPLDTFLDLMEEMFVHVFQAIMNVEIPRPFQRLTYREAMDRYGSDKPDLRFELPITDIGDVVKDVEFRVFQDALASGGVIKALVVPGCAEYSRKQLDGLTQYVAGYGLKGLATIAVQGDELKSSISKFFTAEQLQAIVSTVGASSGDLVLVAAAKRSVTLQALGALRSKLGHELGLADEGHFRFLWIVDFPLFSYNEEEDKYDAEHHPFTMPKWEDLELLESNPGDVRAQAYDLVLNGFELSSGSMRIFQRDIQERMFKVLGFTQEEAHEKFGFLLDAFEYGTPPHGGVAFGLDRIIMIMGKGKSLRDCIAFPKTSGATDLMTDAPSTVSPEQMEILHLEVRKRNPVQPTV